MRVSLMKWFVVVACLLGFSCMTLAVDNVYAGSKTKVSSAKSDKMTDTDQPAPKKKTKKSKKPKTSS